MSGRITPMDEMPTPDFAVPYAAPRFAKTMAEVTPMKPKNAEEGSQGCISCDGSGRESAWKDGLLLLIRPPRGGGVRRGVWR